jgi:hypothetical protein
MNTYRHVLKELLLRSRVRISTTWLVLSSTLRVGAERVRRALTR